MEGAVSLKYPNIVEWKITDFFSLPEKPDYYFESPTFTYMDGTWCLLCIPRTSRFGCLAICLKRLNSASDPNIIFQFGIEVRNECIALRTKTFHFEHNGDSTGANLHVERSYLLKHKEDLAPDDVVTFTCIFRPDFGRDPTFETKQTEGISNLSQNLKATFLRGDYHDIVLQVQEQAFRAHKFILAARSPIFASMFRYNATKQKTDAITLEDYNPKVFRILLSFLYSGELEKLSDENVIDLYVLADKYQVHDMKSECVKFMIRNISVDNFCDFISIALRHNEIDLLNGSTNFFIKNAKGVILTKKWLDFLKLYPVESNGLHVKYMTYLSEE